MFTVSPASIVSLDGRVVTLSPADAKVFQANVVQRWRGLADSLRGKVPLGWVISIIFAESAGNPNALRVEPSGATGVGLMQLTSPFLKGGLSDAALMDPATNIRLGCAALTQILRTPPGDLPSVASRYNCGANKDGSPHTSPTSGQNPSWGLCATAGYLERVSGANNAFLTSVGGAVSVGVPGSGSLLKPLAFGVLAALAARRFLR